MRLHIGRLLFVALLVLGAIEGQQAPKSSPLKPYRMLVVVAAWGDPASQVISENDSFPASSRAAQSVVCSLRYSAVGPAETSGHRTCSAGLAQCATAQYSGLLTAVLSGKNLAALNEAVLQGTNIIVAASRFTDPALERMLGLHYLAAISRP